MRQVRDGVAGYYHLFTNTPGPSKESKMPGEHIFEEDGHVVWHMQGKWTLRGSILRASTDSKYFQQFQVTSDALKSNDEVVWTKQKAARPIRMVGLCDANGRSIALLNEYRSKDTSSHTIEFKANGLYTQTHSFKHAWTVKGDVVGLRHLNGTGSVTKGHMSGGSILFTQNGIQCRFEKQADIVGRGLGVCGEYAFYGGTKGDELEKVPGFFLFNQDHTVTYILGAHKETPFTWKTEGESVQLWESEDMLFDGGVLLNGNVVFERFGTIARFVRSSARSAREN